MKPITDFELLVVGKNDDVNIVTNILLDGSPTKNFKAIDYADTLAIEPEGDYADDTARTVISGSLAVSVERACLEVDNEAYARNLKATPNFKSLEELSRLHNVSIEVYSEFVLTGHGFEEHYIIENGAIIESEIKNIEYEDVYHPDGTLKEVLESGGFDEWDYSF